MNESHSIHWIQGLTDGAWRNLQRCDDHNDAIAFYERTASLAQVESSAGPPNKEIADPPNKPVLDPPNKQKADAPEIQIAAPPAVQASAPPAAKSPAARTRPSYSRQLFAAVDADDAAADGGAAGRYQAG